MGLNKPIIKEYVNPELFGAVGDGITDDTNAFLKAIEKSKHIKGDLNKKYFIKSTLYVDDLILENCHIVTDGSITLKYLIQVNNNGNLKLKNCIFECLTYDFDVCNSYSGFVVDGGKTSNVEFIHIGSKFNEIIINDSIFKNSIIDIHITSGNEKIGEFTSLNNVKSYNSYLLCSISNCKKVEINNCIVNQNSNADNLSHCIYLSKGNIDCVIRNSIFNSYSTHSIHCINGEYYNLNIDSCKFNHLGIKNENMNCILLQSTESSNLIVKNSDFKNYATLLCSPNNKNLIMNSNIDLQLSMINTYNLTNKDLNIIFISCNIKSTTLCLLGNYEFNTINNKYMNCNIELTTPEGVLFTANDIYIINCELFYQSSNDNPLRLYNNNKLINSYFYNSKSTKYLCYASGLTSYIHNNVFENIPNNFYGNVLESGNIFIQVI